ncbi:hypothetical protein D3C85_378120 [compost metagenome]
MSTNDYLDKLSVDQLRYCRDEADRRVKVAEESPKKVLWQVSGGIIFGKVFKSEDYEAAFKYYLKVLEEELNDERLIEEVLDMEIKPKEFNKYIPKIEIFHVNNVEYKEFFK